MCDVCTFCIITPWCSSMPGAQFWHAMMLFSSLFSDMMVSEFPPQVTDYTGILLHYIQNPSFMNISEGSEWMRTPAESHSTWSTILSKVEMAIVRNQAIIWTHDDTSQCGCDRLNIMNWKDTWKHWKCILHAKVTADTITSHREGKMPTTDRLIIKSWHGDTV